MENDASIDYTSLWNFNYGQHFLNLLFSTFVSFVYISPIERNEVNAKKKKSKPFFLRFLNFFFFKKTNYLEMKQKHVSHF